MTPGQSAILAANPDYLVARVLPSGELAALRVMLFTVGLCVGLEPWGVRTRFCYPDFPSALQAIMGWDGRGDPPGPWIKQKPEDRVNPTFAGVPISLAD